MIWLLASLRFMIELFSSLRFMIDLLAAEQTAKYLYTFVYADGKKRWRTVKNAGERRW